MNEGKDNIPSHKKKFLYMDKFVKHQDEDKEWKKKAGDLLSKVARKTELGLWADITTLLIALTALGIALIK